MASPGPPLLEAYIYKHTIVGDYVVKRYAQLYPNCFTTRRKEPAVDPEGDCTTYELDHTAKLIPAEAAAIERKKRHIRPHGVGSMTALAAIRGKGQSVELWTFKIEQSHAWDFRFCFEERSQADQWHAQLSQVIDNLRVAAGAPKTSQVGRPLAPGSEASESGRESHAGSLYEAANSNSSSRRVINIETFKYPPSVLQALSSHVHEGEDAELSRLMNFQPGPTHSGRQTRWVPYRHSNGLAIYQHQGQGSCRDNEYMVSAVVRGSPPEVLRALLDPMSSTTILGPALEAEVLESTPGRQVLRIKLQAVGPTAAWFRPREAVVQRLLKKDEDGVYVVLFSSIDTADSKAPEFGVIEIPEGIGGGVQRNNPIRCRVSGGYTISKRQGYKGTSSPESLLTCILQVQDMGGWLNPCHPLFRLVDWWSGGAYEAFLERMLLGVMLVRDVVEKSRFVVAPQAFAFYEEESHSEAAEADGAPFIADEDGKAPQGLRTSTFVMREAATHFSQQAAEAARSPARRSVLGPKTPFERAVGSAGSSGSYSVHLAQPGVLPRPSGVSRLASQRLPGSLGSVSRGSAAAAAIAAAVPEVRKEEEPEPVFKLPSHFYEEIHTPGRDFPFKVRGGNYLTDGVKVHAGQPMFELLGMELVDTGGHKTCPHISRFLPSVRRSSKPFLFVFNLMVPGPPTMCCVFVFGSDTHPDELGTPPDDPEDSDWQPFDFLMWRFINGDDDERRSLFKMIPHIKDGSWLIKQSVGTTPVILARKLGTEFFVTEKYVEVAVDVGSSSTAQYVTGMVRGGARNLVLDLGLVLEGHNSWELPEVLVGAVRVRKLDLGAASKLDDSKELPMRVVRSPAHTASAESKA